MKKTLITLMALAGVAMGETYNYSGDNNGWFEARGNWTNAETSQSMGTGDMTAEQVKNSFVISGGKTVRFGGNAHNLNGAKVTVEGSATLNGEYSPVTGATLTADGGSIYLTQAVSGSTFAVKNGGSVQLACTSNTAYSNLIIDVDSASSLSIGTDAKLKNVTINTEAAIAIGNVWIDGNGACGDVTFNLGTAGVVKYAQFAFNSDGYNGTFTLNANCIEGYLVGSGDIVMKERTLLTTTNGFVNNGGSLDAFMSDDVASAITLNGVALTGASFDSAALSTEDVGKYQLVYTDNAIKVQYVAYAAPIPEPTTATLSLLALAGLAARRRRK